jgi:glycogen operon protein
MGSGFADITWHGTKAWNADWSINSRTLAFMLCGRHAKGGQVDDNTIYVAMNMHWEMHGFELPKLPHGMLWHVFANTDAEPPHDIWEVQEEKNIENQAEFLVGPRSIVILVGK